MSARLVPDDADFAAASGSPPRASSHFVADLAWLADSPSRPGDRFWLRHGTRTVLARIKGLERVFEPGAKRWRDPVLGEATLPLNGIAQVAIETQQPLDADVTVRDGGTFTLVETSSDRTVAAGMIRAPLEPATD
jgi:sulfate adenylyltransferase subunit 1 (EFTu-like GTPase family)